VIRLPPRAEFKPHADFDLTGLAALVGIPVACTTFPERMYRAFFLENPAKQFAMV
jgi:hypothetical protein